MILLLSFWHSSFLFSNAESWNVSGDGLSILARVMLTFIFASFYQYRNKTYIFHVGLSK